MNWQAVNFDWNQVRAFLATAEEGSFSAAARALKSTQPTLTRQVSGLENELNVVLFERGPRGLTLTAPGRELLSHVQDMGSAAGRISMVAMGQSEGLTGEVSVTAVDFACKQYVFDAVDDLKNIAPGISIRILASNEVQNLALREADIAIRHVRPSQSELVSKLVATKTANLYAMSDYLDVVGRAKSLRDLENYTIVGQPTSDDIIKMYAAKGVTLRPEQFRLPCNSAMLIVELVLRGHGISLLPDDMVAQSLGLEKVFAQAPPLEFPIWLTSHRELHSSKKIRVVFDALERALVKPRL